MKLSLQLQDILSSSYNTESKQLQISNGKIGLMKQKKGFPFAFIKRLLILVLVFGLSSCEGSQSGELANQSLLPTSTQELIITTSPLGSSFKLDNYRLNIPKDWFFTVVNDNQMNGWAFMSDDPSETSVNGFENWAGGLWVVSPVPPETNLELFSLNLKTEIENYGQSEFEAILLPVQQAGLLDLSDAEIVFDKAGISTWAGNECLQMSGTINLGNSGTELSASVYLMWTTQNFISYYDFSDISITSELATVFQASRESLIIP